VAFATTIFSFFVWFDEFHLGDAKWPPHARAHLLWLMTLVVSGGACSLAAVWRWWDRSREIRIAATLFPCLVWAACLVEGLVLCPMIGVTSAYSHARWKVFGELEANVFGIAAPLVLGVLGYVLDRRAREAATARATAQPTS